MRWAALFADLEAQLDAAERDELAGEVADRTRRELARLGLADRLRAAVGCEVTVSLGSAATVTGTIQRVGPEWFLLCDRRAAEVLVVSAAVAWIGELPAVADDPANVGAVAGGLGLGYVLRTIARDRAAVTVVLRDGPTVTGTVDRVGADFVDLAEHPADEPRRREHVRGVRTIGFTAMALVRPA